MKPHKHAEVIKAWADGASIEYFDSDDGEWVTLPTLFFWSEDCQYRIKPAEPEKVYPVTRMTYDELHKVYTDNLLGKVWDLKGCEEVANAAIRRAIDDGQVMTKSDVEKRELEIGHCFARVMGFTWDDKKVLYFINGGQ